MTYQRGHPNSRQGSLFPVIGRAEESLSAVIGRTEGSLFDLEKKWKFLTRGAFWKNCDERSLFDLEKKKTLPMRGAFLSLKERERPKDRKKQTDSQGR